MLQWVWAHCFEIPNQDDHDIKAKWWGREWTFMSLFFFKSGHSSSSSKIETKPCEGDLLVVRHMLRQVSKELEPIQIENIFYTIASMLLVFGTLEQVLMNLLTPHAIQNTKTYWYIYQNSTHIPQVIRIKNIYFYTRIHTFIPCQYLV